MGVSRRRVRPRAHGDPDERLRDALIFVAGTMDKLRTGGLIEGGFALSKVGRARFEELKAAGFEPTDEEFRLALAGLVEAADEEPSHADGGDEGPGG